jgi:hypothetical protein
MCADRFGSRSNRFYCFVGFSVQIPDAKYDKPNVFKLRTAKLDYFFSCIDTAERAGWMDAIRNRQSVCEIGSLAVDGDGVLIWLTLEQFVAGLSRPPGSPLSLETLQGLAAPLYSARYVRMVCYCLMSSDPGVICSRPLVTFALGTPGAPADATAAPDTPGAVGTRVCSLVAVWPPTRLPTAGASAAPVTPALPQYVPPGMAAQSTVAAVAQEEVSLQAALSEGAWACFVATRSAVLMISLFFPPHRSVERKVSRAERPRGGRLRLCGAEGHRDVRAVGTLHGCGALHR